MGASLNPQTDDPEFVNTPRHEFNLWFDPEAAHIVLTRAVEEDCLHDRGYLREDAHDAGIDRPHQSGQSPAARYVGTYARLYGEYNYLWDELAAAAWLDPSLITKSETRYMDVDLESRRELREHADLE